MSQLSLYYTISVCDLQGTFSIEWVSTGDTHCIGQFGGDEGDRTPDLDSAIVALSQLSYVPELGRSYHIGARL